MVSLSNFRMILGFGFKGFGISWSLADKFICNFLCNGKCGIVQSGNCTFLLLFVGIIFIVCGYALIVMRDKERISLKKKIKKNIKLVHK